MAEYDWHQMRTDAVAVLTGDFTAVFVKTEATQSTNGKPMIKCQIKIEAGQYAGRVVYHNFTISPESPVAMKMFFLHMDVLGLGNTFFAGNPSLQDIAAALLGKRTIITLESRQYQGVDRENIKNFKSADAGVIPGMAAAALPVAVAVAVPVPVPVAARVAAPVLSDDEDTLNNDPF